MTDAFKYRPKFVDIRVKKGAAATAQKKKPEPVERPCDYVGCPRAGEHKAPKGRDHTNQFWHFCVEHAADYNRRWNYFSGMSDSELADYQRREEVGHRPTWTFKGGKGDRLAAAARGFQKGGKRDPYEMFGGDDTVRAKPARRLSRVHATALETMQLTEDANAAAIRARYAELVKRWHPDSNGGDRGAEEQLQRVVHAYQVLKTGGLV